MSRVGIVVLLLAMVLSASVAMSADPAPTKRPPPEQQLYPTLEEAGAALLGAMRSGEGRQIRAVLGPGSGALIASGDRSADQAMRKNFVAAYEQAAKFDRDGDAKATILLGEKEFPFPFPLVKEGARWRFDAKTGAEEIVARRIGDNELAAMRVCLAYVDAQREYVLKDRNSAGFLVYAQKLASTPGKRDGLYWDTKDGEPRSPFGPIAVQAQGRASEERNAYHGYRYKILTGQGSDAPGGAYDYVVRGRMIGGFALVAYPVRWGVSGVVTFMVNHDGAVYEKNLGQNTGEIAAKLTLFNPDSTWTKSKP
jgi:hypothetical protein